MDKKNNIKRLTVFMVIFLSACGIFSPDKPEPVKTEPVKTEPIKIIEKPEVVIPETKKVSLIFIPSTDLNQMHGKSYPLKVSIYQLKSAYNFEGQDFRAITDNEKQALKDDVIEKEDLRFKPGQSPQTYIIETINPKVKYIGFIAYYMDIKHAKWQKIYKVSQQNHSEISVYLTAKNIIIK